MIRTRKIRGHKWIWRCIDHWKSNAVNLDLNELKPTKREYTKVYVYPFFSIDVLNLVVPSPKGKTRSSIVSALFDIYTEWKAKLDTLGEPYYLKIWFYPENVGKSQVVCAIGEMMDWYNGTFYKPEKSKKELDMTIFSNSSHLASDLNWEFAIDELSIDDEYLGSIEDWSSDKDFYDSRRWLKRKMTRPHRKVKYGEHIYFNFPQYSVWLGGS